LLVDTRLAIRAKSVMLSSNMLNAGCCCCWCVQWHVAPVVIAEDCGDDDSGMMSCCLALQLETLTAAAAE